MLRSMAIPLVFLLIFRLVPSMLNAADAMDEVMYDPLNRLAWENLRDHTLTLGNDENVG